MSHFARVNVLLSLEEGERFNAYCLRNGFKKSTLIARLVRDHLDREDAIESQRRKKSDRRDRAA